MKISQAIEVLETILRDNGDLTIKTFDLDRDAEPITEIEIGLDSKKNPYVYIG